MDQLRDMKLGETDAVIRCSTEHGRALQNKLLPGGEMGKVPGWIRWPTPRPGQPTEKGMRINVGQAEAKPTLEGAARRTS